MRIAHMTAEYVPQVAALEKVCFSDPWSEKSVASELENPLSCWLVALDGETVAGYVGSQTVLDETDMMNVAVHPDFRRQGVARALILDPKLVVCDEPVSALDVSIQAQIINLLKELQDKYNLTYLFISHDLSVVEHISDTVGVMYLGNLVEYGATPDIFSHPLHPYTKALFSAIPIPDPTIRRERIVLQGSIPSPANPPKGCKFHTRCPYATERCKTEAPQQREVEPGHYVVCHLYEK